MSCLTDTPSSRKNNYFNASEGNQLQSLPSEGFTPYAILKRLGKATITIINKLKQGIFPQINGNKTIMVTSTI